MRSRSNSGVRLDYYYRLVSKTILANQNPITGLIQATPDQKHAWVRDNVYSIMSVWGLALAYRKQADLDEDRAKAYELEQQVVKLMRGLLMSMMKQVEKLEDFKKSQCLQNALHAKYDSCTGDTCVGDGEWGHLQIDATSLYILMLSQMTVSGLQIIFTLDEVAFIQNLIFYIEDAYRIADYGIWERGDKTNHGLPELNSTSIGMAKAAMEAIDQLDLFGARGGPQSVIHVQSDKVAQCQAILHSMLPRESNSKEIDAGLLSIIGYPAFAVDDESIVNLTRQQIIDKLQGRYGCKRFLRDGYKTAREDVNRLYYEPAELKIFENIECEWPLFWTYLILDGIFRRSKEQVDEYADALEDIVIRQSDGTKVIPELYYVPADKVELEYKNPHSQDRLPAGKTNHLWGQSLYILGCLLREGFIAPGEVDPLNRRLSMEPKPDLVVQVALLTQDPQIQEKMKDHGFQVQTVEEVAPIQIRPARVLSYLSKQMGYNEKLGLSGNVSKELGLLSTSKLYSVHDIILAFLPQFMDHHQFYLALDNDLLADISQSDLAYLRYNWREIGRPTITIEITRSMWEDEDLQSAMLNLLRKFQSGYVNGVQIQLRNLSDVLSTSCIKRLNYLETPHITENKDISQVLEPSSPATTPEPSLRDIKQLQTPQSCQQQQQQQEQQHHPMLQHPTPQDKSHPQLSSTPITIPRQSSTERRRRRVPSFGESDSDRDRQRARAKSFHGSIQRTRTIHLEDSTANQDARPLMHLLKRRASIVFNMPAIKHVDSPKPQRRLIRGSRLESPHSPYMSLEGNMIEEESDSPFGSPFGSPKQAMKKSDEDFRDSPFSSPPDRFHLLPDADGSSGSPMKRTPSWFEYKELEEMYKGQQTSDLVRQLQESDSLLEQADIVHYLFETKGLDWDTDINNKSGVTVKTLMEELYYKSAHHKTWSLVRHTAGILQKRVEHLAKAVTDMLVRQKQVSVGLPPEPREVIITAPMPPEELMTVIYRACGEDRSSAVLTQELLIYLSMFICTEPNLFTEMLRLRVGLIIQVMTSELARAMECEVDDAYEHLVTLSPYEIKDLLHHILSSREFVVNPVSKRSGLMERQLSIVSAPTNEVHGHLKSQRMHSPTETTWGRLPSFSKDDLIEEELTDRQGQWLRRRRLDGALNRAPPEFYHKVWKILEKCQGLRIVNHFLPQHLTREMTPHEFKFALRVEEVLNRIPQPEYRQLMVECLMVISLVVENDWVKNLGGTIATDKLVAQANEMFLLDQVAFDGDATLCCASTNHNAPKPIQLPCGGIAGICINFYDSAPSGRYGTMTYLARAVAKHLNLTHQFAPDETVDCKVS